MASCDASLNRLGAERIDLYYQHRLDPSAMPRAWSPRSVPALPIGGISTSVRSSCPFQRLQLAGAASVS